MKSLKILLSVATLSASLSSVSVAGEFSYNYIQASYASIDIDVLGTNVSGNGVSISGSFDLSENLAFDAEYSSTSYDFGIDSTGLDFGVTFHTPIAPKADFTAGLGFVKSEVTAPGFSDDDTASFLDVGIRNKINDTMEVEAGLSIIDIGSDSSTSLDLTLGVDINKKLQFGIGFSTGDDVDVIFLGLRSYL